MSNHLIKEAKKVAARLRGEGEHSGADAIDSLAHDVEYYESRQKQLSTLKKGDKVVMHTCMESDNPKYLGKIWTCRTDAFRHKGHNYCSIFLEGFSGSFSAEFLQLVKLDDIQRYEILVQAIRDGNTPNESAAGLIAWLESTTSIELNSAE